MNQISYNYISSMVDDARFVWFGTFHASFHRTRLLHSTGTVSLRRETRVLDGVFSGRRGPALSAATVKCSDGCGLKQQAYRKPTPYIPTAKQPTTRDKKLCDQRNTKGKPLENLYLHVLF